MEHIYRHIKDLPVKVSLIKSVAQDIDKGYDCCLYVSPKFTDFYGLANLRYQSSDKYVIRGRDHELLYIALILNSVAGRVLFSDDSKTALSVNTRTLANVILPPSQGYSDSVGCLLEVLVQWFRFYADADNHQIGSDVRKVYQICVSLLSLVRNYLVEQLYLPDLFERNGVDIISAWNDILNEIDVDLEHVNLQVLDEFAFILMTSANPLFEEMNKMKVFQSASLNELKRLLTIFSVSVQ